MAGDVSKRSVSKVAGFWKVRVSCDPLRSFETEEKLKPRWRRGWPKATQWVSGVARPGEPISCPPGQSWLTAATHGFQPTQGLNYPYLTV